MSNWSSVEEHQEALGRRDLPLAVQVFLTTSRFIPQGREKESEGSDLGYARIRAMLENPTWKTPVLEMIALRLARTGLRYTIPLAVLLRAHPACTEEVALMMVWSLGLGRKTFLYDKDALETLQVLGEGMPLVQAGALLARRLRTTLPRWSRDLDLLVPYPAFLHATEHLSEVLGSPGALEIWDKLQESFTGTEEELEELAVLLAAQSQAELLPSSAAPVLALTLTS